MTFRMFAYLPRHGADLLPTRSNPVPAWHGLPRYLKAALAERGRTSTTQGETEVRYVSLGDTENS